jgi:hypothetical protein
MRPKRYAPAELRAVAGAYRIVGAIHVERVPTKRACLPLLKLTNDDRQGTRERPSKKMLRPDRG